MKRFLLLILAAALLAGCGETPPPKPDPPASEASAPGPTVPTMPARQAMDKAGAYYPAGVALRSAGQVLVDKWDCHLFEVYHGDSLVSRAAVSLDGQAIWFADMLNDGHWFPEAFLGLPNSEQGPGPKPEPHLEFTPGDTGIGDVLAFANIADVEELSARNEGRAIWSEDAQTLDLVATKSTGTVTGAIDGPMLRLHVLWQGEEARIISINYEPAPRYSHPQQVLFSGETLAIGDDRLVEIAAYFRDAIRRHRASVDASTP